MSIISSENTVVNARSSAKVLSKNGLGVDLSAHRLRLHLLLELLGDCLCLLHLLSGLLSELIGLLHLVRVKLGGQLSLEAVVFATVWLLDLLLLHRRNHWVARSHHVHLVLQHMVLHLLETIASAAVSDVLPCGLLVDLVGLCLNLLNLGLLLLALILLGVLSL